MDLQRKTGQLYKVNNKRGLWLYGWFEESVDLGITEGKFYFKLMCKKWQEMNNYKFTTNEVKRVFRAAVLCRFGGQNNNKIHYRKKVFLAIDEAFKHEYIKPKPTLKSNNVVNDYVFKKSIEHETLIIKSGMVALEGFTKKLKSTFLDLRRRIQTEVSIYNLAEKAMSEKSCLELYNNISIIKDRYLLDIKFMKKKMPSFKPSFMKKLRTIIEENKVYVKQLLVGYNEQNLVVSDYLNKASNNKPYFSGLKLLEEMKTEVKTKVSVASTVETKQAWDNKTYLAIKNRQAAKKYKDDCIAKQNKELEKNKPILDVEVFQLLKTSISKLAENGNKSPMTLLRKQNEVGSIKVVADVEDFKKSFMRVFKRYPKIKEGKYFRKSDDL
jgi:hypothetical protein